MRTAISLKNLLVKQESNNVSDKMLEKLKNLSKYENGKYQFVIDVFLMLAHFDSETIYFLVEMSLSSGFVLH